MSESQMKKCTYCKKNQSLSNFTRCSKSLNGKKPRCKTCRSKLTTEYQRSKKGRISAIYSAQKHSSKHRNHPLPNYTFNELFEWAISQPKYHELHADWENSNWDKMMCPSCDRLDDYKPYTLDNMRLVSWKENVEKSYYECRNGINNKRNVAVSQFDLEGNLIANFHSISQASRETGVRVCNISECIHGIRGNGRRALTCGGYIWKKQLQLF